MKLRQVRMANFRQFRDIRLDLTYPKGHERQGEPLDRICLLGTNGSGKSTLLQHLVWHLVMAPDGFRQELPEGAQIAVGVEHEGRLYYRLCRHEFDFLLGEQVDEHPDWFESCLRNPKESKNLLSRHGLTTAQRGFMWNGLNDLVVYCPAESSQNQLLNVRDVPNTTLDRALQVFQKDTVYHVVSTETVEKCWERLIYLEKKRENDFREFELRPENQNRSVREVREEFDRSHPRILESLAELWDCLLAPAGLMFDHQAAQNPIQLSDNLKAYIILRKSGEKIPYHRLSAGIRNFLFRIGHIHALHFGREIKNGFLMVDEPENSLYPDFLYDLLDIYQRVAVKAQIFMATHSPIVAAQFEPSERFILSFDEAAEDGAVFVRRGETPEGDDSNDILTKDFRVRSVYGPRGKEAWDRYIELRNRIQQETDPQKKERLTSEYLNLGLEYNFPAGRRS